MTKQYTIAVDCAHCAAKMEDAVLKLDDVRDANINFMGLTMTVTYREGADIPRTNQAIVQACKRIERDFSLEE